MACCWGVAHGTPKGDAMPRQKDLKRLVRTRMTKTGEAYSTARAQLLKKRNSKSDSSAASAKAVAPDYAALAGMSDAKVAEKTGHTWAEWVELLDREGAAVWQHRDIVGLLNEKYDVPG